MPREVIERKPLSYRCAVCDKSVKGLSHFVCKYCGNEHCESHRLPENHSCPSPKNPYSSAFSK